MFDSDTINSNDLDNLKMYDPQKYEDTMALINKKNELNTYADELYGTEDTTQAGIDGIIKNYITNLGNYSSDNTMYADYKAAMNSDEIKAQNTAILDKK
jgi:hypothetical protein